MNSDVKSIFFNILGGIIVAILSWLWIRFRQKKQCWQIKKIMGQYFTQPNNFYLVYALLVNFPFKNDGGVSKLNAYARAEEVESDKVTTCLTATSVVSGCEVRAANYISNFFGINKVVTPILCSDKELSETTLASCVSFGGPGSNGKTASIEACPSNYFLSLHTFDAITDKSGKYQLARNTKEYCFGYILRM
ncbi:MAG: hypothetical protein KJ720_04735 [Proteobacteria bacterium]|nr:hypothetical protein [Pseudomonadota bacterium]MBU1452163.1 hypothetical protein [Pseudomonadota bacterium]MBU2467558.1 hypothetical protein [Pseudomonadota bacterium]MBU2518095.1 hypothetical protein [Pseudomonadota bacterium]